MFQISSTDGARYADEGMAMKMKSEFFMCEDDRIVNIMAIMIHKIARMLSIMLKIVVAIVVMIVMVTMTM